MWQPASIAIADEQMANLQIQQCPQHFCSRSRARHAILFTSSVMFRLPYTPVTLTQTNPTISRCHNARDRCHRFALGYAGTRPLLPPRTPRNRIRPMRRSSDVSRAGVSCSLSVPMLTQSIASAILSLYQCDAYCVTCDV
jgi:hypothetical protein